MTLALVSPPLAPSRQLIRTGVATTMPTAAPTTPAALSEGPEFESMKTMRGSQSVAVRVKPKPQPQRGQRSGPDVWDDDSATLSIRGCLGLGARETHAPSLGRTCPRRRPGRWGFAPAAVVEPADQALDVVAPALVGQLQCVAPRDRPQLRRQVLPVRHPRPGDEHGNRRHVGTPQGGLDLDPDEVLGIGEPRPPLLILYLRPRRPHDDNQHVAGGHRLGYPLDEVDPGRHVHVHEHVVLPEPRHHRVVQAPGVGGGVLAPVGDEDLLPGSGRWPCRPHAHPSPYDPLEGIQSFAGPLDSDDLAVAKSDRVRLRHRPPSIPLHRGSANGERRAEPPSREGRRLPAAHGWAISQRREFHEALLEAASFEDCLGSGRRRSWRRSRTGRSFGSCETPKAAATTRAEPHLSDAGRRAVHPSHRARVADQRPPARR